VAFNVADERTFEAAHFRPFDFKGKEPLRGRAVRCVAWSANTEEIRPLEVRIAQLERALTALARQLPACTTLLSNPAPACSLPPRWSRRPPAMSPEQEGRACGIRAAGLNTPYPVSTSPRALRRD
jgi:hypothetical protein